MTPKKLNVFTTVFTHLSSLFHTSLLTAMFFGDTSGKKNVHLSKLVAPKAKKGLADLALNATSKSAGCAQPGISIAISESPTKI